LSVPARDAGVRGGGRRGDSSSVASFPCLGDRRAVHQTPTEALPPGPPATSAGGVVEGRENRPCVPCLGGGFYAWSKAPAVETRRRGLQAGPGDPCLSRPESGDVRQPTRAQGSSGAGLPRLAQARSTPDASRGPFGTASAKIPGDHRLEALAGDRPNVVARELHAAAPNRVWVTDMTYIWT
jgi:hypothetical protein